MRRNLTLVAFCVILWAALSVGIHALTRNNSLGSDFFIYWQAGRAALIEGENPYSDELARQAQLAIFKREAAEGEDQLGFAYPPYAFVAILPLLLLPYDWAQAVWIAFLLVVFVTVGMVAFPRARRWVIPTFLLFYPVFFGLILGNFAVLLAAGLILFFGRFLTGNPPGRNMQIGFGLLAGWMTVKPQFIWLYLIFICFFAIKKQLWWFLGSAALSLAGCILVSFALVPNWISLWIDSLVRYSTSNQTYPVVFNLLRNIVSQQMAIFLSAGIILLLVVILVRTLSRWWYKDRSKVLFLALIGLTTYLAHPQGKSYEQLVFLVPLVLWAVSALDGHRLVVHLFLWGSLAVSWGAFIVSSQPGAPDSSTEWPLFINLLWVAYMLYQDSWQGRNLTGEVKSNSMENILRN